mgnify:CR=1 FL=1
MNPRGVTSLKGIIAWFASNHVAANLLMLLIIAFGLVSSFTIRKQTTPDFELRNVQVRVPYLGAAPQEVEEGVVIKIEEAIQDIDGIVEIRRGDARAAVHLQRRRGRDGDVARTGDGTRGKAQQRAGTGDRDRATAAEHADAEAVSTFIYSSLDAEVLDALREYESHHFG